MGELGNLLIGLALFGNMALAVVTFVLAHNTGKSIKLLEQNTNSIKDALVSATAKASFAEGVKRQKDFPEQ